MLVNAAKKGFIIKQNRKHKWEKRWFALDGEYLFYFKTPNVLLPSFPGSFICYVKFTDMIPFVQDARPVGVIDVRSYTLKEGEGRKKSFAWDLILSASANPGTNAKKPNYSLKTEREVDRKEWMMLLQKVIDGDKEEGPKPSPPPTLSSLVGSGLIKAKGGKKGNILANVHKG